LGLDFVTACTPSFRRHWDRGRERLAQPDLFARAPELKGRTFRAVPSASQQFSAGEALLLEVEGREVSVRRGHATAGTILHPPPTLTDAIRTNGGVAAGVVLRVHPYCGDADIALR
jgi:hypothetical protein